MLRSREARIILGAAVIDDILGLILLSVVSAWAGTGGSLLSIALIAVQALLFVAFVAWAGTHASRRYAAHLERARPYISQLGVAMALMLGLAALAGSIGLAGIIGAFLAGMVLAESRDRDDLERTLKPLAEFLVPFFFVVTGTRVSLAALGDGEVALLALAVTLVAIVSKLLGAGLGAWGLGKRSQVVIGVGMVPRGEVGLIVAGIGRGLGIIPDNIFAVVVLMSVATTLVVPPALVAIYRRSPEAGASSEITPGVADADSLAGVPGLD